MSETPDKKVKVEAAEESSSAVVAPEAGPVSKWLNEQGFEGKAK